MTPDLVVTPPDAAEGGDPARTPHIQIAGPILRDIP